MAWQGRVGMGNVDKLIPCIGCGAWVADVDGPTFRYPDAASPGCWAVFGEILAREYGEYRYPDVHRLTVDVYAVQHPGRQTPQTIQSVNVHLIGLCLTLQRGVASARVTEWMGKAVGKFKGQFVWLDPPASLGPMTVLDVIKATNLADHEQRVWRWALSCWEAWSEHHAAIRRWVELL